MQGMMTWSVASTSAPLSSRASTSSTCPLDDAKWRAVWPFCASGTQHTYISDGAKSLPYQPSHQMSVSPARIVPIPKHDTFQKWGTLGVIEGFEEHSIEKLRCPHRERLGERSSRDRIGFTQKLQLHIEGKHESCPCVEGRSSNDNKRRNTRHSFML
jgi:hypothetical protein